MPKVHEMIESKFLKKEEVEPAVKVTIAGFEKVNVAKDDAVPDHKWTMSFQELDKPLVMNSTNIQMAQMICESDDTDDWIGKQVVLYNDPNVSYGGKITGGIRIRKPKAAKAPLAMEKRAKGDPGPQPGPDIEDLEDDIPFAYNFDLASTSLSRARKAR